MSFSIVILTKNAENLAECLKAVFEHEPDLPHGKIVVVDDGVDWAAVEDRFEDRRIHCGFNIVQGKKPFNYARNANLGIKSCDDDVVLLNDDAVLKTPNGFGELAKVAAQKKHFGIISCGIDGIVCNENQKPLPKPKFRIEHGMVAFMAVYIKRTAIAKIGLLDERFEGYGCEDSDYCRRAHNSDLRVGVWDGCVVEHGDESKSSFRVLPDWRKIYNENLEVYWKKWQQQ